MPGVVDRLTDTSKYTGSHKERFDDQGKGKGIAGRQDVKNSDGSTSSASRNHDVSKASIESLEKKKVVQGSLGKEKFGIQVEKPISIYLFRNGDKNHEGERVLIKNFKNFDQLLTHATNNVKLTTGPVKKIYKRDLMTQVKGLDELEDGRNVPKRLAHRLHGIPVDGYKGERPLTPLWEPVRSKLPEKEDDESEEIVESESRMSELHKLLYFNPLYSHLDQDQSFFFDAPRVATGQIEDESNESDESDTSDISDYNTSDSDTSDNSDDDMQVENREHKYRSIVGTPAVMLIKETYSHVESSLGKLRLHVFCPQINATYPGIAVFTEIYQVTGPVERFCRQIASQGYVVACPESYHEFLEPGTVLPYDTKGTDLGNQLKVEKKLESYDEDAKLTLDFLQNHPKCNGRLGTTGMCLGGHLAFRCSFDERVLCSVCYFATDIHGETLGKGKKSDSLVRCGEIKGEILMIFGKQDTHVPVEGRRLIYNALQEKSVCFSWCEFQAQHAFIRDESSKDRYDAALAKNCFELLCELFFRKLYLVEISSEKPLIEHVC